MCVLANLKLGGGVLGAGKSNNLLFQAYNFEKDGEGAVGIV